ncbi:hypothetical protein ACM720_09645 [Neisseria sp. LNP16475]|nr:hypothetical protein [Neisseria mucosa]
MGFPLGSWVKGRLKLRCRLATGFQTTMIVAVSQGRIGQTALRQRSSET